LAAVVAKALHKQPVQRHADGNQLADELAELAHSGRAASDPPTGQGVKSSRGA
jgi:hypothetical protein